MPIYEYECECGNRFEEMRSMKERHKVSCFCGGRVGIRASLSTSKPYRLFHKDGEGFSSVAYRPEEYKERVKNNMGKYDT